MKKVMRNTIILAVFFVAILLFAQSIIETKAADTGIAGDANADGCVDVKDVVRGKRHVNDSSVGMSGDIDLNKNAVVGDDKDYQYLRVLLIGEYKETTLADKARVGKYDNEEMTFDLSIPDTIGLGTATELDSAMIEGTSFTTKEYANGKLTLNSDVLTELTVKTVTTVFETGTAKVNVVSIPIDVFTMVINDETELNYFPTVAQKYPSGYYVLGNDIYCTGTYVSNHNVTFKGTFNGCLYTIYNMNAVCGTTEYGGLFGRNFGFTSASSAYLKNISFVNASYSGKGGFIASQIGGTMESVYIDITMKDCGTGANISSSAVLGTNSYGALNIKKVFINYNQPLSAGATTGTAVYEMHPHCNSYQGLYVVGADTVGVKLTAAIPETGVHDCGAYLTEAEFLAKVADGSIDLAAWDNGFWKIRDGETPMPIPLAPCIDTNLEDGVLADFNEGDYRNNVGKGRVVGTSPAKTEVLASYADATGDYANGVLKIIPTPNANGKFDFSLRFGQKIQCSDVEDISVRIAQTNIDSPGYAMKTFFVSTNRSDVDIWSDSSLYNVFEVAENDWTTITISKSVLEGAQDDEGYVSEISFHCDYGCIDETLPANIYIDEVYYTVSGSDENTKIGVISDVHFVDSNNGHRETNLKRALNYYRKNGADLIIMNGDVSDLGTVASYQELVRVVKEVYPDETTRPKFISTADNHEYYDAWSWKTGTVSYDETQSRFLTEYANKLGQTTLNTHEVINGYHFIGVSADSAEAKDSSGRAWYGVAEYSENTVQWLESVLAEATAEDASKPVFVAVHQPPRYTVTSSTIIGNGNEALTEILAKYPQAVVFSSHTHSSIKQENSIYQKDFTVVNTGSLFYIGGDEMEYTNTGNIADYLPNAYNFGEGLLVTVSGNKVNIERRDFFNQETIKTDWVIEEPANKENYVYTDARITERVAPTFALDATLSVEKLSDDSVVLKFPSAMHDDFVHYYTVKVYDEAGNSVQLYKLGTGNVATTPNYISDFYFGITRMATNQEFVVKGLSAGVNYTFEVCAVETFGKTSEALTASFAY